MHQGSAIVELERVVVVQRKDAVPIEVAPAALRLPKRGECDVGRSCVQPIQLGIRRIEIVGFKGDDANLAAVAVHLDDLEVVDLGRAKGGIRRREMNLKQRDRLTSDRKHIPGELEGFQIMGEPEDLEMLVAIRNVVEHRPLVDADEVRCDQSVDCAHVPRVHSRDETFESSRCRSGAGLRSALAARVAGLELGACGVHVGEREHHEGDEAAEIVDLDHRQLVLDELRGHVGPVAFDVQANQHRRSGRRSRRSRSSRCWRRRRARGS